CITVKGPNWNLRDGRSTCRVSAATEWQCGSKDVGAFADEVPSPVAAHRLSGNVETLRIDTKLRLQRLQYLEDQRPLRAEVVAVDVIPPESIFGTLRRNDESRMLGLIFRPRPEVSPRLAPLGYLLQVVLTNAAGAMQPQDKRVFLVLVVTDGNKQTVR